MEENYLPVLVTFVFVVGFAAMTILMSWFFGRAATSSPAKDEAYECGIEAKAPLRPRFSVKFYLIAMLFLLFDIEVVFLYPWAAVFSEFEEAGNGLFIFVQMLIFLFVLFVGWIYALRKGGLEWSR